MFWEWTEGNRSAFCKIIFLSWNDTNYCSFWRNLPIFESALLLREALVKPPSAEELEVPAECDQIGNKLGGFDDLKKGGSSFQKCGHLSAHLYTCKVWDILKGILIYLILSWDTHPSWSWICCRIVIFLPVQFGGPVWNYSVELMVLGPWPRPIGWVFPALGQLVWSQHSAKPTRQGAMQQMRQINCWHFAVPIPTLSIDASWPYAWAGCSWWLVGRRQTSRPSSAEKPSSLSILGLSYYI